MFFTGIDYPHLILSKYYVEYDSSTYLDIHIVRSEILASFKRHSRHLNIESL